MTLASDSGRANAAPETIRKRHMTAAHSARWFLVLSIVLATCPGCSESSAPAEVTTLTITSPGPGDLLTGTVTLGVDTENATRVEYFIDGNRVASSGSSPFGLPWNSSAVENGPHTLRAVASGAVNSAVDEVEIAAHNTSQATRLDLRPLSTHMAVGETLRFEAEVFGPRNRNVRWALRNGPGHGTIDGSGRFIAPLEVPRPPKSIIEATPIADPEAVRTAEVVIHPAAESAQPRR